MTIGKGSKGTHKLDESCPSRGAVVFVYEVCVASLRVIIPAVIIVLDVHQLRQTRDHIPLCKIIAAE